MRPHLATTAPGATVSVNFQKVSARALVLLKDSAEVVVHIFAYTVDVILYKLLTQLPEPDLPVTRTVAGDVHSSLNAVRFHWRASWFHCTVISSGMFILVTVWLYCDLERRVRDRTEARVVDESGQGPAPGAQEKNEDALSPAGAGRQKERTEGLPGDESNDTNSPTAVIAKEHDLLLAPARRVDEQPPLFREDEDEDELYCQKSKDAAAPPGGPGATAAPASCCDLRFTTTFHGIPVWLILAEVVLNTTAFYLFFQSLALLPASHAQAVMMVQPGLGILLQAVAQPQIKYNAYMWLAVMPIVLGGVLVASASHSRLELSSTAEAKSRNSWGLIFAFLNAVVCCTRYIVLDAFLGEFERGLLRSSELAHQRNGAGGADRDVVDQDAIAETTDYSEQQETKMIRPPSATKVLWVMLPFNAMMALLLSVAIERDGSGWSPVQQIVAILQGRFAISTPSSSVEPEVVEGRASSRATNRLAPGELDPFQRKTATFFLVLLSLTASSTMWFLTEFRLVERLGAVAVAALGNVNVASSIIFAVLLIGEPFSPQQLWGCTLIIAGIVLKTWKGEAFLSTSIESIPAGDAALLLSAASPQVQVPEATKSRSSSGDAYGVGEMIRVDVTERLAVRDLPARMGGVFLANGSLSRSVSRQLSKEVSRGISRQASRLRSGLVAERQVSTSSGHKQKLTRNKSTNSSRGSEQETFAVLIEEAGGSQDANDQEPPISGGVRTTGTRARNVGISSKQT